MRWLCCLSAPAGPGAADPPRRISGEHASPKASPCACVSSEAAEIPAALPVSNASPALVEPMPTHLAPISTRRPMVDPPKGRIGPSKSFSGHGASPWPQPTPGVGGGDKTRLPSTPGSSAAASLLLSGKPRPSNGGQAPQQSPQVSWPQLYMGSHANPSHVRSPFSPFQWKSSLHVVQPISRLCTFGAMISLCGGLHRTEAHGHTAMPSSPFKCTPFLLLQVYSGGMSRFHSLLLGAGAEGSGHSIGSSSTTDFSQSGFYRDSRAGSEGGGGE